MAEFIYITKKATLKEKKIDLFDLYDQKVDINNLTIGNESDTITRCVDRAHLPADETVVNNTINALGQFCEKFSEYINTDLSSHYKDRFIPKKTGGLRPIKDPDKEIRYVHDTLKYIFESIAGLLYHTSAGAYIKRRCTVDTLKKHQFNNSKWYAKFDFSDFFGSTTPEYVFESFSRIYPMSEVVHYPDGARLLKDALSTCFLKINGKLGLPQGSTISPMITNIMMIPIDFVISKYARKNNFVYTRYADDTQFSSRVKFNPRDVEDYFNSVLSHFNAPFKIKPEKTRFGSSAGRNWNLGLMINKDNNITVGWRNKKQFKAMLFNYMNDRRKGVRWEPGDINHVLGLHSYFHSVEPEAFEGIVKHYNEYFNEDVLQLMKEEVS